MSKVVLALIGRGKWGQNYINTIQGSSLDFVLPDENIKTRDYSELFRKKNVGGVIVATPTSTHFEIAKNLIEHGFNVLIEKPITKTYKEAMELEGFCKPTELTVMAGHIQLYDPAYIALKKNLNLIGDITRIEYKGLQSPVRNDATVLEDWGPHPIYIFMDLAGGEPSFASAKKMSSDNIWLKLKFSSGIEGVADIGWTYPERKRGVSVFGKKGSITIDGSSSQRQLYFKDKSSRIKQLPFPSNPPPLVAELVEFVNCVKTGRQSRSPLEQGVAVMKVINFVSFS